MKPNRKASAKPTAPRLPWPVLLAYLLVCTLLLTGVSFARYTSGTGGTDTARVAAGCVEVHPSDSTTVELTRPKNDGVETADFSFSVSNGNSEVAIRYDIIVTLDKPLPDGVTLALDGNTGSPAPDEKSYTFAGAGVFPAGPQASQSHTLSFTGDFNRYQTPGTFDYPVTISVRATQID